MEVIDYSDKKEIGKTGERVSAIGLGTWAIRNYDSCLKSYIYALEHGVDNIDTAEMYDGGKAEEFVGKLVKEVGRDAIFITTKMMPERLVSRDEVLRAARASLNRLGLSYVDLFLIHWPNESMSIEKQVKNFEAVYHEEMARYIGVSNFNVRELEEAICATTKAEIVVDQVYYNVLRRDVERELLPFAVKHSITIQAYTPLERGKVKGVKPLDELGARHGRTSIQVALNYLVSMPRVVALPKAERMEHVEEVLGAMGWRLSLDEIKLLRRKL